MDETISSTNAIHRREALRRLGILAGSALCASTVAAVLADTGPAWAATPDSRWRPRTLNPEQDELVAVIAEHIIPATDTPGARQVGVHRFIDVVLTDHYGAEERDRWLAGLADVDARARSRFAKSFTRCSEREQVELLRELDAEAYPPKTEVAQAGEPEKGAGWFWRRTKELTLGGYYTSEIGATRELRVSPWGQYRDIPYKSVGRSWA